MSNKLLSARRLRVTAAGLLAAMLGASSVAAQTDCGLCNKEVTVDADLASCFLERYAELARSTDTTVVVDLSDCTSRGIVEALPGPDSSGAETPDTEFMVSRGQLECLKKKLEDPNLVMDPAAKIDLESCG